MQIKSNNIEWYCYMWKYLDVYFKMITLSEGRSLLEFQTKYSSNK